MGYVEVDFSVDVDGLDVVDKIVIFVFFGFGGWVKWEDVVCEGIRFVSVVDIVYVDCLGFVIKLLAIVDGNVGEDLEVL